MAVQQRERSRVEELRARLVAAKRRVEEERQRKAEIARRLADAVYGARLGLVAELAGECKPKRNGYGYFCKARAGRLAFGLDTYNWYVDLAVDGKYVGYVGDGHAVVSDYEGAEEIARILERLPQEYFELGKMLREAKWTDRELAREIAEEMIKILEARG